MSFHRADFDRVRRALDSVTIAETPRDIRPIMLTYVIGYAIGGLRALGISKPVIESVLAKALDEAP